MHEAACARQSVSRMLEAVFDFGGLMGQQGCFSVSFDMWRKGCVWGRGHAASCVRGAELSVTCCCLHSAIPCKQPQS
eukprot:3777187-Rhodomonas_salina.1